VGIGAGAEFHSDAFDAIARVPGAAASAAPPGEPVSHRARQRRDGLAKSCERGIRHWPPVL